MVKPTHWTVNASDIVAHIFYSVWSTDELLVTSGAGEFTGTLSQPERAEVLISSSNVPAALVPGAPICVEYAGIEDSYRFYTEVLDVRDGKIRAQLPYAVEHSDRRILPRFPLPPNSGLAFRAATAGSPTFPLVDISTGGLSFFDRHDAGMRAGARLEGELLLPGEAPIPMDLEIRRLHLRRAQLLVGGRIAAISLRNRARLAWFLSTRKARVAA